MLQNVAKGVAPNATVLVLVVGIALSGCKGKGSMGSEIDEETGAYTILADDAGKDTAVAMSGGIEVAEGQVLVVSPTLEEGSIQVTILDADTNPVVDEKISGKTFTTYELEPGDYGVGATCLEDGTTGTVLVCALDKAEIEQQDADLAELLGTADAA